MNYEPLTLRRMAAIAEIASLGFNSVQIATLLRVTPSLVRNLASKARVSLMANRGNTVLRAAIRAGYEAGHPPALIAKSIGTTESSVKTTASSMGLTRNSSRDPFKHKRPYKVPADRMREYHELRSLGMTIRECGYEMGLLDRSQDAMRRAA